MMLTHTSASVRRTLFALWALVMAGLPTLRTLAQEGTEPAAESSSPQGVTVMLLMLGVAAILMVGFYYVGQNRPPQPEDHEE